MPERIAQQRIEARPESRGLNWLREKFSRPLVVLMALASAVLLITCANVANLLLARATARTREMAIRASLGAGRSRLVRQLLTESLTLALAGGVLGLLLAQVAAATLVRLAGSGSQAIEFEATLDSRALVFTAAVSVLTGVVFGLAPAWKSAEGGVAAIYGRVKRGGGTLSVSSRVLISGQVALSLVLLAGAGLFVRSLQNLRNLDSGFRRDHLLLVRVNPQLAGWRGPQVADLYAQILERASALPGVVSITFQRNKPFTGEGTTRPFAPPGYMPRDQQPIATPTAEVGPRYFETLGLRLVAGRDFRASDDRNAPKVIAINEAAAREFFPGRNPIGARIGPPDDRAQMEVIAVAADARHTTLRAQPGPMVYEPVLQNPRIRDTTFFVRTVDDPGTLAPRLRELVRAVNPNVPVMEMTTIEAVATSALMQERLLASLASVFGGLALVLAAVGLGGVLLFAVTRRTQEIGIRMALGATRVAVVTMVIRESFVLVLAGLIIGVPCAIAAGRAARELLFGLTPADPVILGAAATTLAGVALLATFWPARRAAKIDPIVALRCE